jgi:transposase
MYEQLFPHLSSLCVIDQVVASSAVVRVEAHTRLPSAICPRCGQPSSRVHSHYVRTLWDLPCSGRPLQVQLQVRRFRCTTPSCPRTTFSEPLLGLTQPYARRSAAQREALEGLGYALGGRPAAKQARRLGLAKASPSTMLRLLRGRALPAAAAVRVLGIDDWAWRKGRRYGTILVDLERHQPVDLLAEYSVSAIADWLRRHRSVRIIVRDRSPVGIQASQQGAPRARQVADRFHLLLNLTDQLAKGFQHHPPPRQRSERPDSGSSPPSAAGEPLPDKAQCFAHMQHLRAQGWSHRAIAQVVGVSYKTVERWLRNAGPPAAGGSVVRRRASRGQAPKSARLGPRQAAWLFVQSAEQVQGAQRQQLEQLLAERPELLALYELAQRFVRLVHERQIKALAPWLREAQQASWPELRQLARGLLRDQAAVRAALQLPYSNGPVEGQVTRLKLLKRQMYGRAKLALLRSRFLKVG